MIHTLKHKLWIVSGSVILTISIMTILHAISPINSDLYRGTFHRLFVTGDPKKLHEIDAGVNSFYIAGITRNRYYFGNSMAPFHLLTTDHLLQDSQRINLKIPIDSITTARSFRLQVDSPYFYLTNGILPKYLRGELGKWKAYDYMGDTADFFVEALPIGPNSLILKSVSARTKSYELAYKNQKIGLRFNEDLLNKQIDGLFCLDGKIIQDKSVGNIIYVHTYRNEYIVADTTLKLLFRGTTLDTFSRARLRLSKITGTNEVMMSSPDAIINKAAAADNGLLYIMSAIASRNENESDFLDKSVIDVFDLRTNRYFISFYIPSNRQLRTKDFRIYNNTIVTVAGNYVATYVLPNEIQNYLTQAKDILARNQENAENLNKKSKQHY